MCIVMVYGLVDDKRSLANPDDAPMEGFESPQWQWVSLLIPHGTINKLREVDLAGSRQKNGRLIEGVCV